MSAREGTVEFRRNAMSSLNVLVVIFLSILTTVQPALYRFIPEDADVFTDCTDRPEFGGIHDFADLTDMNFYSDDDGMIHASGTGSILWDIEQTDRISVDIELKKYGRGSWHQTFLSLKVSDLCKEMRDKSSIAYESFAKYIFVKEGEQVPCFGKGEKYQVEQSVKSESDVKGVAYSMLELVYHHFAVAGIKIEVNKMQDN
uniref:Uncharacterized protein n=1 Tax=Glossina pallidipes TaxID=7398 RepID=A0A1B0AGI1_GLOPL